MDVAVYLALNMRLARKILEHCTAFTAGAGRVSIR